MKKRSCGERPIPDRENSEVPSYEAIAPDMHQVTQLVPTGQVGWALSKKTLDRGCHDPGAGHPKGFTTQGRVAMLARSVAKLDSSSP